MEPSTLYHILEERRRELGLTQSEVTERAFGRKDTSAIQNIRRGKSPSVTSAAAICEALGLEFYIGPKRVAAPQLGSETPSRSIRRWIALKVYPELRNEGARPVAAKAGRPA